MVRQGKDIDKLRQVVDTLIDGKALPPKNRDHTLITTPRFQNCRECHIEPDWLLVYRIERSELILILVETGTHSELFGK